MSHLNIQEKYGLVIILLSIVTRIFVVSIAWNYGIFITAIKQTAPGTLFSELGWIAGLAQGLGSLISPMYIVISKKLGFKLTFFVGIFLCFLSLLASSFVPSEHFLFLTYSLPYGIGSSIIFVLGSLLTGMYYPPNHKYHVTATVSISLGFPIGFLIINPLNESLLKYYDNDWQLVQRIYSVIVLILMGITSLFFTDKYSNKIEHQMEIRDEIAYKDEFLSIKSKHLSFIVRFLWLFGLVCNSIANTSILTNLNGYLTSSGVDSAELKLDFVILGLADGLFRIFLAIIGPRIKKNLSSMYILASFFGFILSNLWADHIVPLFNTIYCLVFGMCPAVLMSLMYSVNTEITGTNQIEKNYTINVMMSGVGIIIGPLLSGLLLDTSDKNYDKVFKMAYRFYFMCIISYSLMKFLLLKYSIRVCKQSREDVRLNSYSPFKNES
ncbi:unnamed protein product [Brachionus calyciflorus]|uniref:Major facilitator superfamily (MFS) profile domain-containing protein n=1 Tax=Brachionus calyciflorus TaxID=104777 RepID=A0A813TPV3_9BILA|nr:unnamed protein product [Brachionus calyciflorus]